MNSPDPWRDIIGADVQIVGRHGGGGGGAPGMRRHGGGHHGHHGGHGHHGHHGRRYFGGGYDSYYPYPYPYAYYPYFDWPLENYTDEQAEPQWVMSPYGPAYIQGALTEPPRERDGLLSQIAPVLAPATGGITASVNLDQAMVLHGEVVVDGVTYRSSVNLAPVINALLVKMRHGHAALHAPQVAGDGTIVAGGCGARLFYGVDKAKMSTILKRLVADGTQVTGNNPWSMQISRSKGPITVDIGMTGRWNPDAQTLLLEITDSPSIPFVDVCSEAWSRVDQHMRGVGASSTPLPPPMTTRSPGTPAGRGESPRPQPQAPVPPPQQLAAENIPTAEDVVAAIDRAVNAARQTLVEQLVQQHVDTVASGWIGALCCGEFDDGTYTMSAGWFDKLKGAAKGAIRGLSKGIKAPIGSIGSTLKKYKGPIASAAGFAAAGLATSIPGGAAFAPMAGNLAQKLTLAAAGEGSAKKALEQAREEAKQNPKAAKLLATAEKAVAQTTAAYHIAETARAATAGDEGAATEIKKLAQKAQEGDKAAQIAMKLAEKAAAPETATVASGDYEVGLREIAKKAIRDAFRQRGGKYAMEPGFPGFSNLVYGYRLDGNHGRVYHFDGANGTRRASQASALAEAAAWFNSIAGESPDYVTIMTRESVEQAGPNGPLTFLTERWGGGPIESVAAVSGELDGWGQSRADADIDSRGRPYVDPRGPGSGHRQGESGKIKYILVLDQDGNLTKRRAIYAFSGPLPDYWVERATTFESFWMFLDPNGSHGPITASELGPNAPEGLLGARYNIRFQEIPPLVMVAGPSGLRAGLPASQANRVVRILDEDGNLTNLLAVYPRPGKLPNYFVRTGGWIFLDPNGELGPVEPGPLGPDDLNGARYNMVPLAEDGSDYPQIVTVDGSPIVGTGGPRVEIIGQAADALELLRKQASDAAAGNPAQILGVIRWADGNWALEPMESTDDADDWFGYAIAEPHKYTYAAYFNKSDPMFPAPLNESIGTGGGNRKPRPAAQPIPRGIATVQGGY